jgi:hypothetical protein
MPARQEPHGPGRNTSDVDDFLESTIARQVKAEEALHRGDVAPRTSSRRTACAAATAHLALPPGPLASASCSSGSARNSPNIQADARGSLVELGLGPKTATPGRRPRKAA